MSFVDHLEELRWHIVRSLIAVILIAIVIFLKMDVYFDTVIMGPLREDFVSYDALCRFSRWVGLGDALCVPATHTKLQATTFSSMFNRLAVANAASMPEKNTINKNATEMAMITYTSIFDRAC